MSNYSDFRRGICNKWHCCVRMKLLWNLSVSHCSSSNMRRSLQACWNVRCIPQSSIEISAHLSAVSKFCRSQTSVTFITENKTFCPILSYQWKTLSKPSYQSVEHWVLPLNEPTFSNNFSFSSGTNEKIKCVTAYNPAIFVCWLFGVW